MRLATKTHFTMHNHSDYSNASLGFADSINTVEKSVNYAIELGLSGYVITEHESLSSHIKLMKYRDKLEQEGKITHESFTIGFGDEIYLVEDLENIEKFYHHLLIAKDEIGHKILRRSSTQAWENSFVAGGIQRTPITRDQLKEIIEEEGKGHIISSTACLGSFESQAFLRIKNIEESAMSQEEKEELILIEKQKIEDFVLWNLDVFGSDFYIELAPNSSEEQRYVNRRAHVLAQAYGVKCVFSTDSHYLKEEDREVHKAYLNSKEAEREVDSFYYTAYMMDTEKVKEYLALDFSEEEFEEMLEALEEIRLKLKHYSLFKEQEVPLISDLKIPERTKFHDEIEKSDYKTLAWFLSGEEFQNLYWARTCLSELEKQDLISDKYLEQLEKEAQTLKSISERLKQPMAGYYNTAQKVVEIMWNEGDSLVGTSRGSAMGFLSNYLLGITQIDPIPYVGSMEWRHLSPSRPELPKL